jgi:hypothetical protein
LCGASPRNPLVVRSRVLCDEFADFGAREIDAGLVHATRMLSSLIQTPGRCMSPADLNHADACVPVVPDAPASHLIETPARTRGKPWTRAAQRG